MMLAHHPSPVLKVAFESFHQRLTSSSRKKITNKCLLKIHYIKDIASSTRKIALN
jgi:hypothetical protein